MFYFDSNMGMGIQVGYDNLLVGGNILIVQVFNLCVEFYGK